MLYLASKWPLKALGAGIADLFFDEVFEDKDGDEAIALRDLIQGELEE